ncbi:ArsR/SmtB family transcription factor [Actinocorallia longicatena]|uniref:DUF5937 family protein n=1 Tax=Actinocorallia longicatena TaxID=111803 RepID=A0ABP6Q2D7_9ACTN
MRTELAFSTADLAQTRFAVSPLWEVATAYRTLAAGTVNPAHRRWADQVRPRVAAAGLDRGMLSALIPPGSYLADFLTPLAGSPFPTLESELAAVVATTEEELDLQLAFLARDRPLPPSVRILRDDPAEGLDRVAAELRAFWDLALAPYWARIRRVLEADVFHRARTAAEHGPAAVLNDLHAAVSWDEDTLRLVKRQCGLNPRMETGAGLVLVPSVFAWPGVMTWSVPPYAPQLCYPARGSGTLWEMPKSAPSEALSVVLGRSRAALLAELETPASTTDLAARTGLSAAAVSQHLTALRDAGFVTAHRAGRSVLYARTEVSDTLLT